MDDDKIITLHTELRQNHFTCHVIYFVNEISSVFSKSTDADFVNVVQGLANVYVQVAFVNIVEGLGSVYVQVTS